MLKLSKQILLFLTVAWPALANAQAIQKQSLKVNRNTYNYYETNATAPVKGLLILLPAAGENPKSIFGKTQLPELMSTAGYITIAPEIPTQMFADDACINELDELVRIKTSQYKLTLSNVVLGGLSDGGSIALGYTEHLYSKSTPTRIRAVFAIDPPADLARIYNSAEQEISYKCPLINREGKSVKAYLDKTLGGPPHVNSKAYYEKSTFSASDKDGGNARFLRTAVVRLYCEPDLQFVQKTYCPELQFSNLNAFDLQKLAGVLKDAGNDYAEYIATTNRGFHSWNIVDAQEFVDWLSKQ